MYQLNRENALAYGLRNKLCDVKSIIDSDVKIIDFSRKNRNIKLNRKRGTSYFLKQPDINSMHDISRIRKEARLYKIINRDSNFLQLRSILPSFYMFDQKNNILVTESLTAYKSFYDYCKNFHPTEFPFEPFLNLGRSIASYHKLLQSHFVNKKFNFVSRMAPPNIVVVRPTPSLLSILSAANLDLIRIIQHDPELVKEIEKVYFNWDRHTIINGDLKWDNVLLYKRDDLNQFDIKIIDWELIEFGDPAWDIAGILHDFLIIWINSLNITGIKKHDLDISMYYPLDKMKKAMRNFWRGYLQGMEINARAANTLLLKSARYCAARLVQKTYEMHANSSSLSNKGLYIIQLSRNIFKNTENSVIHLFGIPFRMVL